MVDKKSIQRLISFDDEDTSTGFVSASGDVLTFRNLDDVLQCFKEFLYTKDIIVKKISSYNGGVRINLEGGVALDCMGGIQNMYDTFGVGCYDGDNLREMKLSEENISLFFKDLSLLSKEPRKHLLYAVTQLNTWKNMTVRDFNPYVERLLPLLKEFCGIYGRRYLKVNESLSELVTFDDEDTSTGYVGVSTGEYKHFESSDDLLGQFFDEFEKITGSPIQNFDTMEDFVFWDFEINGKKYNVSLTYTDNFWGDEDDEEETLNTTLRNIRDKKFNFTVYRLDRNGDEENIYPSKQEDKMFQDIIDQILRKFKSKGYLLESLTPVNLITFDDGDISTGFVGVSEHYVSPVYSLVKYLYDKETEWCKSHNRDDRVRLTLESLEYGKMFGLGELLYRYNIDDEFWDTVNPGNVYINAYVKDIDGDTTFQGGWLLLYRDGNEYKVDVPGTMEYLDGEKDYANPEYKKGIMIARGFVKSLTNKKYLHESIHQTNLYVFDDGEDVSTGYVGVTSEGEEGVITRSDITFLKRLGNTFKNRKGEWGITAVLNPTKQHQAGICDPYLDVRDDMGYIEIVGWEGDFESLIEFLQTGKGFHEDLRDVIEDIGFCFVLSPEFEFVEMDSRNAELCETITLISPQVTLSPGKMSSDFKKFVNDADAFEWAQAFWENNELDSVFRSAGMEWTADNMDEVIDNSGMKERFQELIDYLKRWIKSV